MKEEQTKQQAELESTEDDDVIEDTQCLEKYEVQLAEDIPNCS